MYDPYDWQTGDIITAGRLNAIEDGLRDASSVEMDFADSLDALFTAAESAAITSGEATLGIQLTAEMAETLAETTSFLKERWVQGSTPTVRFRGNDGKPYGATLRSVGYGADYDTMSVQLAGGYMDADYNCAEVFDFTITWHIDMANYAGYAAISIKKTPITYVPIT